MFLEIAQNSQENTCSRNYFLIKLQTKISKNTSGGFFWAVQLARELLPLVKNGANAFNCIWFISENIWKHFHFNIPIFTVKHKVNFVKCSTSGWKSLRTGQFKTLLPVKLTQYPEKVGYFLRVLTVLNMFQLLRKYSLDLLKFRRTVSC